MRAEFGSALEAYNRALALQPNLSEAYCNRGVVHSKQGKFEKAITDFQHALNIAPQNSLARFELGFVYQQQGRYEKAAHEYEKMLPESGDNLRLHHNLSRCYIRLDRLEEATRERKIAQRLRYVADVIDAAERKIRESPDNPHAYMELADIYFENNQPEKAFDQYKIVLAKNPRVLDAYDKIAAVYMHHNQQTEAIPVYEVAIGVDPKYIKGHLMLGLLYRQQGKPKKSTAHLEIARKLTQKVVEAEPTAENLDALASIYYVMHDYTRAEAALQKAINLDAANQQILDNLGRVRRQLENRKREEVRK